MGLVLKSFCLGVVYSGLWFLVEGEHCILWVEDNGVAAVDKGKWRSLLCLPPCNFPASQCKPCLDLEAEVDS